MRTDSNLWLALIIAIMLCPAMQLRAQTLCGGNPTPLSNFCNDACITCELDGLSAITTHSIIGTVPPGYCTFIAHSMQWVGFVAGSVNLSFNVTVSACTQGNSIELGVYESLDCSSFNLVSNCHTAMFVGNYTFSNTQPLKPGCYYYIVIDGNGPASCSIDISVTSGSATAPMPVITGPIMGDSPVCLGESANYSIPEVFGACDYTWEVTGGTTQGPLDGNEITVLWDQSGTGEVCVTASNVCHSSARVCKQVKISQDSPPTNLGPFEICAGSSYPYMGRFYSGGIWPIEFQNQSGCDTSVLLEIIEIPVVTNNIEAQLCFPDCYRLGNNRFCKSGQYIRIYPSLKAPFCDSIVVLDLEIIELDVSIAGDSLLDCNRLEVTLKDTSKIDPGAGAIKRYWLNENGDTLGTSRELMVSEPGWYYLQLLQDGQNGICGGIDSFQVLKNQLFNLDLSVTDSICLGSSFELEYTGVDTSGLMLSWSWGNKDTTGQGPFSITPQQTGSFEVSLSGSFEGCPLDSIVDSVWVQQQPEMLNPICQNTDSSLVIRWQGSNNVSGYDFESNIGLPFRDPLSDTSWNFTGLMNGDTVQAIITGYGINPCGLVKDTVQCVFNFCPNIDLAIRPLDTLCLPKDSAAFQLSFSRAGSANLWPVWTGPGIIDSNLGRFDPKQAGEGTHTIQLQLGDSLCNYTDSIDIVIEDVLTPGLEICFYHYVNTPTSIEILTPLDHKALWEMDDAVVDSTQDPRRFIITWPTPGRKTIELWLQGTHCTSDRNLTVKLDVYEGFPVLEDSCQTGIDSAFLEWPGIEKIDSFLVIDLKKGDSTMVGKLNFVSNGYMPGDSLHFIIQPQGLNAECSPLPLHLRCRTDPCPDFNIEPQLPVTTLCTGSPPIPLDALITNGPDTGRLVFYDPSGRQLTEFDPSLYGVGSYRLDIEYEIFGCTANADVTIEVRQSPQLTVAGDSVLTCLNPETTLRAELGGNETGLYTWTFQGQASGNASTINASQSGIYRLVYTDSSGQCSANAEFAVLDSTRGPERINFTPTDILCDDRNSGIIDIQGVTGPASNYEVFLNGELMAGRRMTGLGAGRHSLTAIDENGCELDTFFTIKNTPPLDVQLFRDTVIAQGQSVQLQTITSRPAVRYDWMPPVPCGQCPDPVVSPANDTRYTVRAFDDQGCSDQDAAFVRVVNRSLFIPNAFSPNGDGANDHFNVFSNETVELVETMEIFDRWGNRLFTASGFSPNDHTGGWDGRVNGEDINPGVYLYCVVLRYTDGSTETHCGDITLIR